MSLPTLLLVDDSESVLAFESAALSRHYATSLARTGAEALASVRANRPALVLLDLSMPEMDGDEVLKRLRADPEFATLPIVIVSSEQSRADQCMELGANAVLHKPVKADVLVRTVEEVLSAAREKARQGGLAVLPVRVGGMAMAFPLAWVISVQPQAATLALPLPVPAERPYLSQAIELRGEVLVVLELAQRLGLTHHAVLEERKLVILALRDLTIAVAVDEVLSPLEVLPDDIITREKLASPDLALRVMVKTAEGPLPVLEPEALIAPLPLLALPAQLAALVAGLEASP